MSCGDWRGVRRRETDVLPPISWMADKRAEVESDELLRLEALRNRRRCGEVGSRAPTEGDDWSMLRHGLKYDCRMRKSGEGAGRARLEFGRLRSDLLLLGPPDSPVTISALWERFCRWKLGVL